MSLKATAKQIFSTGKKRLSKNEIKRIRDKTYDIAITFYDDHEWERLLRRCL